MKRLLLTGASGFVGSHTLLYFLENTDWEIVCLVTDKYRGNLDRIRLIFEIYPEFLKRTKLVNADLSFPINLLTSSELGKIHYVLNLASESQVERSIKEPASFIQNNVSLMCHLLDWCRNSDSLEKIIQIGTDEVYGPVIDGHFHVEWEDQLLPSSPYSASKASQEHICFAYWRTFGLPVILTNTMNIIGEMQDAKKLIPLSIKKILNDEEITLHGEATGEVGSRFYLDARNKADALLFLLNDQNVTSYNDQIEGLRPQKFNIVGDKEQNNLELVKVIAEILKKRVKHKIVDYRSSRPGHGLRYGLNGSKIRAAGWKSPIPFEVSLERTVNWYVKNPEWLSL